MTNPDPAQTDLLATALAKVQGELPKLERDRTVEIVPKSGAPYSYSYVTLANLNDAILPLLARHGLSFVAMPGAGSDGKMCVRYRLLHESGQSLDGEFPISGEGGIQILGGRITYARRYILAALVGVAADEDDESRLAEGDGPRTAQRRATPPTRTRQTRPAADDRPTAQRAQRATNDRPPPLPGEAPPVDVPWTAPVPANPDAPWTDDQRKKVMATFNDLGLETDNRAERLDITSRIVGRSLRTANELTVETAGQVIEALDEASTKEDPLMFLDVTYPPVSTGEGQ
jgi:hypothetical protein